MEPQSLTIVLETETGSSMHVVQAASPLRRYIDPGAAAEQATQDAAAAWGLPDFVCRADARRVGGANRELGDRLLLLDDVGVVLQVKSRVGAGDNPARERSWFEKQVATALRQAHGSIRLMKLGPVMVTNGRGRRLELDANALRWLAVVVVDHPHPPEDFVPEIGTGPNPSAVLLRRDWEFLFERLKSTAAVVDYFQRVAGDPLALGHEPGRYLQCAYADIQAPPSPIAKEIVGKGRVESAPVLPLEPAGAEDMVAHRFIRALFEDVAMSPDVDEKDRLRVLAALDRYPVTARAAIGRFVLDQFRVVGRSDPLMTESRMRWLISQREGQPPMHVGFGVWSGMTEALKDRLRVLLILRHHEHMQKLPAATDLASIAVVVSPRSDGKRLWDTTMLAVQGDLHLTPEEVRDYTSLWRTREEATRTIARPVWANRAARRAAARRRRA